jgi:hypothetical protein
MKANKAGETERYEFRKCILHCRTHFLILQLRIYHLGQHPRLTESV